MTIAHDGKTEGLKAVPEAGAIAKGQGSRQTVPSQPIG